MYKINAIVKVIPRVFAECPNDGVHRKGKDGKIKGVHSLFFDDMLVPKGATCFYWQTGEDGLRVGYSFGWLKSLKKKVVTRDYKLMIKCYKRGISPKPYGIEKVRLNLSYDHKKPKKIKAYAYGIRVQHVFYPKDAWAEYAKGLPYNWNADNHKDHSPDGYKKFVKRAKPLAKEIDTSWKLGDVLWCTTKKRWYLVDCGK